MSGFLAAILSLDNQTF